MKQKHLFLCMAILNLLGAIGLPLLTHTMLALARGLSMSEFQHLVRAGVIVIDDEKAKSYRSPLSGDWGELSQHTTQPFLDLKNIGYGAAAICSVNVVVFAAMWLRKIDVEDAAHLTDLGQSPVIRNHPQQP